MERELNKQELSFPSSIAKGSISSAITEDWNPRGIL
jgi:hypothetical protein